MFIDFDREDKRGSVRFDELLDDTPNRGSSSPVLFGSECDEPRTASQARGILESDSSAPAPAACAAIRHRSSRGAVRAVRPGRLCPLHGQSGTTMDIAANPAI